MRHSRAHRQKPASLSLRQPTSLSGRELHSEREARTHHLGCSENPRAPDSQVIGNAQVFGAGQYAMRMWVKPDRLAKLGVTVPEIVSAIQAQNTVNPAGKAGGEPAPKGQEFTYSVLAQGRLVSPEEFGQVVVRETPDGGTVRVRDVARIDLGSQDYSVAGRFNGKPGAIIATYQLPGSNA